MDSSKIQRCTKLMQKEILKRMIQNFCFESGNGVKPNQTKTASRRMMTTMMKKRFWGSKWRVCDFAWDTLTNCLKKFFVQNNLMLLQMMDDTKNLQVTDSILRFHVSSF